MVNGNGKRPWKKKIFVPRRSAARQPRGERSDSNKRTSDRPPKCPNCGGDHSKLECTKPMSAMSDRKCFECGKPGHTARACPSKGASIKAVADGDGRVKLKSIFGLNGDGDGDVDEFGFVCVRRGNADNRPQPRKATIADAFLSSSSFAKLAALEAQEELAKTCSRASSAQKSPSGPPYRPDIARTVDTGPHDLGPRQRATCTGTITTTRTPISIPRSQASTSSIASVGHSSTSIQRNGSGELLVPLTDEQKHENIARHFPTLAKSCYNEIARARRIDDEAAMNEAIKSNRASQDV